MLKAVRSYWMQLIEFGDRWTTMNLPDINNTILLFKKFPGGEILSVLSTFEKSEPNELFWDRHSLECIPLLAKGQSQKPSGSPALQGVHRTLY